jgi:SAM-dependent methyltransferase
MEQQNNNLQENLQDKFDPSYWGGFKAFRHYKYTGKNLIEEVNSLDPDLVIDVGCGHNRFKGHIKNLIGFDQEPFPFTDIVSSIENINFREHSADVVMALGSVQFGNRDFVKSQIKKISKWVKPGGFIVMRTMKDWFRKEDYPHSDSHYIWSEDDINDIGNENSLEVYKGIYTEKIINGRGQLLSTRLAWWYKAPGERKKYKITLDRCEINERQ